MKRSSVLLVIMLFAVGVVLSGCPAPQKRGDVNDPNGKNAQTEKDVIEGIGGDEVDPEKKDPSASDDETVIRDVFFNYNRYDISGEGREALKNNAKILKKYKNAKIVIEGHCDDRGATEYNVVLGQRRSDAAKNYLVRLGVKEKNIEAKSYGEEKQFCHEATEECWQSNRRSHFVVTY